ncbi:TPA: hypothetical protein RY983_004915 [Escherichia coli]|nr:hypothetical protein [Escherichia coli]
MASISVVFLIIATPFSQFLVRAILTREKQNYFFCIPFRYNNFQIQPDQMSNISGSLDKKSAPTVVRVTHLQK